MLSIQVKIRQQKRIPSFEALPSWKAHPLQLANHVLGLMKESARISPQTRKNANPNEVIACSDNSQHKSAYQELRETRLV
jgi:hypothetical protein